MSIVPDISLNNGRSIPQVGFGVFQIDRADTVKAVTTAFEAGYRHIDTAQMYGNEEEVGEALSRSSLDRDEVFLTTKLNNDVHDPGLARDAIEGSLQALDVDFLDLMLIHWPLPTRYDGDFVSTWKVLEEFYREGRLRSIGVSNFQPQHLRRLAAESDILPVVNQVEVHPYFGNAEVRAYGAEHQIVTEAWSPIAQGAVLDDATVTEIAGRIERSPAQVVLRWHVQRGDVVFPKSTTPERIRENIALFDFELEQADMASLTALDQGEDGRRGPNPDVFDYIPS